MKPITFITLSGTKVHIWIRNIFLMKQSYPDFQPSFLVCSDKYQWEVTGDQWETLRVAMECERDH